MKNIYLDNNATTQVDPRVVKAMLAEHEKGPSNPSSIHQFGRAAHQRLLKAREQVGNYLSVRPDELIFTSSGTESLNLAMLGLNATGAILTSQIEHPAVHNLLPNMGRPIHYLPVGKEGHVYVDGVKAALSSSDIRMIILSAVNGETGVKNPIDEIATLALDRGIPFIVDAVAWLGKEEIHIPQGVTAMTFSSHKIHGPKGVGLLFIRKGYKLEPQLIGGGQESMRRAGTENLSGIVGFAKAIELLREELPKATERMEQLRTHLENSLEGIMVNGSGPRICNASSITFEGTDGEGLLIQLDMQGIAASMGSACSAGALEPSRILLNMGYSRKEALSTIRFSLSRFTTKEEIEQVVSILSELRSSSVR